MVNCPHGVEIRGFEVIRGCKLRHSKIGVNKKSSYSSCGKDCWSGPYESCPVFKEGKRE